MSADTDYAGGVCTYTNLFGLTQYDGQCSFFGGAPSLPQGLGWFVVAGLGGLFAVITSLIVYLDSRRTGIAESAEHFATAGRSIKVGLTACDIVSKWTWAATLLQSANVAWKYGVSGPLWYAGGACIQVILFSFMAVEIKRKCPQVRTVLEIVNLRWGRGAHKVFLVFCFLTNIIVTSMLILGGASVINALTGVDIYAAAFLIPIGVMIYTAQGGLRATFLASWVHVTIVYIALLVFMFLIYATNPQLGSPSKVWSNLMQMAVKVPVDGNRDGSYVTMLSQQGLIFGVINVIGNFGTVFVDQAYWQGAIAARPEATYKGYLLGGICWFTIPFTMATAMGLAARALDLPISLAEANEGLVPPAIAVYLMGEGGAFLMTLQLFMAVTASGSAEQIAVSSLVAYDVFKSYIKPDATDEQVFLVSRITVMGYGVLSGVLAVILLKLGLSLGWVYLVMGIIIGSAVFPIFASLTWKKCSAAGAITGAVVAMPLAIMTWLVTTATLNDGVINLITTGGNYPMLAGNLVALFVSAIICITISLIWPQQGFEWSDLSKTKDGELAVGSFTLSEKDKAMLDDILTWTFWTGGILTFLFVILWPALSLPIGVFTEGYFTFWVILSMIWGIVAAFIIVLLPLYESWDDIWGTLKMVLCCSLPPAGHRSSSGSDEDPTHGTEFTTVDMSKHAMPLDEKIVVV